jgi:flavin reductase (DIM6/NTAB) family NADH-FMN oxidoreductase RutF
MDPAARKTTLRMFTNGVYIITSRNGEEFGGATVTWVSQASFHPALVMAAIRPDSSVYKCMVESGLAAIHILSTAQTEMAQKFFTPTTVHDGLMNEQPFAEGKNAVPVLTDAPAFVECKVLRVVDGIGDHAVVVMEVLEAECRERVSPMRIDQSPWQYGG